MKKHNILIGLGLLSAAGLSSCKEEFIDNNTQAPNGENLRIYTAEAGLETFGINDADKSSRANIGVNGTSFLWNTNDAVSIWDGASGNFKFSAPEDYDDSTPKNKLVFTGTAELEEGAKVWGIYPYYESGVLSENQVQFTLPETVIITEANKPALQSTMFMVAEGEVKGTNIERLNFKHLTGIFQFNITNTKDGAESVSSVSITASSNVFPTVVTGTIGDDKNITYTYSENKTTLTLNLPAETSLNNNASLTAYMSFLPTQGITGDTELTFNLNGTTEVLKGKVADLYEMGSAIATNGYEAGKRYIINLTTEKKVPDTGYEVEGDEYTVLNTKGLISLLENTEVTGAAEKTIKLNQSIDLTATKLPQVATFAATFDGQGYTLSNLSINSSNGKTGLFFENTGTIKNLKIDNITLNGMTNVTTLGILAATNKGKIEECEISNASITITSSNNGACIGFIAGENIGQNASISKVSLKETSSIDIQAGKVNFGGITGKNTAFVIGSTIESSVTLNYNSTTNSSQFAGIVGWNTGGTVKGCKSAATINPNQASHFGGIVSSNAQNSNVIASYCCGNIGAIASGSNTGGIVASNSGTMKGCYSSVNRSGDFGGLCGQANGTITNCYFYNATNGKRGGSLDLSSMKVNNAEALKGKMADLNTGCSDSGFEYIVNPSSNDKEPLILQSTAADNQ